MPRRIAPLLVVLALLTVAAAATAEVPTVIWPPSVDFTFSAQFAPKRLPTTRLAAIGLRIENGIGMTDGSHPPALREFILEIDNPSAIDAKGLPVCRPTPLEHADKHEAEPNCRRSFVGEGEIEFDIAFPEESPFPVSSRMLAFNGGVSEGKTKILVFAHLATPVSSALVIPIEVSKVHKGRDGLRAVAKVPKIAGGYGSVTRLSLKLDREFTREGMRHSYLSLHCSGGHALLRETAMFSDGRIIVGSSVRSCVPKG